MKGDAVDVRLRHWSRWRRRQLQFAWEHESHVDLMRSDARSLWLCSWQRSGSTWLAEFLASAPGTRLVYEPANLPGGLFTGEDAALAPLPESPGPELASIGRAIRGRLRGRWVDQLTTGHVVHRRVVKDVRGVGLLGAVAARHPRTPIVLLLRHPLSIASSVVSLGWTRDRGIAVDDQLLDEVRRWVGMHASALRLPATSRAHVVTYEHLLAEPEQSLPPLLAYLGRHHPTWQRLQLDQGRLTAPSATSFRRREELSASEWIGTFDALSPAVVREAASILKRGGLGVLYADTPEPLIEPGRVSAALRSH
jgi:hypothetical protein